MNCATPPKKSVIVAELLSCCCSRGLDTGIYQQNAPDIRWLLDVMSTLNPGHAFFASDYEPLAHMQQHQNEEMQMADLF